MSDAGTNDRLERLRSRREPPPLIKVRLVERHELTARLVRLVFEGPGLESMLSEPAASVRLLVPSPGSNRLVIPDWNGNEFLLPGDVRPALRTFTPLRSTEPGCLDLEIVRHPGGVVSTWAETAQPGASAAISGPGRGFAPPDDTTEFFLLGDETAAPAIGQLLEHLSPDAAIEVHIEVESDTAIRPMPEHANATISWVVGGRGQPAGSRLLTSLATLPELTPTAHVWAAGEAASMQAIRKYLFDERGLPRSQATVRGYWKPARPVS